MEEKRKDLINTKQRNIVHSIMRRLSGSHPSFYYLSTTEVAAEIKNDIDESKNLTLDDKKIVAGLTRRDIQILLSLRS